MSSADNICKQIASIIRPEILSPIGFKMFDLMVFLKEFFLIVNFEKKKSRRQIA